MTHRRPIAPTRPRWWPIDPETDRPYHPATLAAEIVSGLLFLSLPFLFLFL